MSKLFSRLIADNCLRYCRVGCSGWRVNYSVLENSMFDDKIRSDDCSVGFQALVGWTMRDLLAAMLPLGTFLDSRARKSNFCPGRSESSGGNSSKRTYSTGIDTDGRFDNSLRATFCWAGRAVN